MGSVYDQSRVGGCAGERSSDDAAGNVRISIADETLVDTNVLVYAFDRAEPRKQKRALGTLRRLAVGNRGRLSAQILGEFF